MAAKSMNEKFFIFLPQRHKDTKKVFSFELGKTENAKQVFKETRGRWRGAIVAQSRRAPKFQDGPNLATSFAAELPLCVHRLPFAGALNKR